MTTPPPAGTLAGHILRTACWLGHPLLLGCGLLAEPVTWSYWDRKPLSPAEALATIQRLGPASNRRFEFTDETGITFRNQRVAFAAVRRLVIRGGFGSPTDASIEMEDGDGKVLGELNFWGSSHRHWPFSRTTLGLSPDSNAWQASNNRETISLVASSLLTLCPNLH